MDNLKMSISGVRGIVNDSLTLDLVERFTLAFIKFLRNQNHKNGKIILGNDSRPSYKNFEPVIINVFNREGFEVLNLGTAPTPTVLFTAKDLNACGAMILTASHNPIEWNGLKFVNSKGQFISQEQWDTVYSYFNEGEIFAGNLNGNLVFDTSPIDLHIKKTLSICKLDKVKKAKFRVGLDTCNGAGSLVIFKLLEQLDCEVFPIFNNPENDDFGRKPEPLTENLSELENLVKENHCDVGFALDPDADRLAIVSEQGKAIGEEYTLAFAVNQFLKEKLSDITVNISTSRMIDDIADKYGVKVFRSKVGEINVLNLMEEKNCQIGGEGNGGVIFPEINSCRDSLVSIVFALDALADSGLTVSKYISDFPVYTFIKDKVSVEGIDLKAFYSALLEKYSQNKINDIDGIRIDLENSWFQIRESNTEPIIRIFAEGESENQCLELINDLKEWIQTFKA